MKNIFEGLEKGDLRTLVKTKIYIDKHKSKMGRDRDIIVCTFIVKTKDPAIAIVDFIEKGYKWVLDADVSSGENENGEYIVFVEIERNDEARSHIIKIVSDICSLTNNKVSEFTWSYHKQLATHKLTLDELKMIPSTPDKYEDMFGDDTILEARTELDRMRETARVKVTTKAPVNQYTEMLRVAAGLK